MTIFSAGKFVFSPNTEELKVQCRGRLGSVFRLARCRHALGVPSYTTPEQMRLMNYICSFFRKRDLQKSSSDVTLSLRSSSTAAIMA